MKTHVTIVALLHLVFSVIALTLTAMIMLKALLSRLKKGLIVFGRCTMEIKPGTSWHTKLQGYGPVLS